MNKEDFIEILSNILYHNPYRASSVKHLLRHILDKGYCKVVDKCHDYSRGTDYLVLRRLIDLGLVERKWMYNNEKRKKFRVIVLRSKFFETLKDIIRFYEKWNKERWKI